MMVGLSLLVLFFSDPVRMSIYPLFVGIFTSSSFIWFSVGLKGPTFSGRSLVILFSEFLFLVQVRVFALLSFLTYSIFQLDIFFLSGDNSCSQRVSISIDLLQLFVQHFFLCDRICLFRLSPLVSV